MQDNTPDIEQIRIVHGRPWKDAVIKLLEPTAPYRPWINDGENLSPNDGLIVILGTDPVSVVAGVGVVGNGDDLDSAITAIETSFGVGLFELETLNMLADFVIEPREPTVYCGESPQQIADTIRRRNYSTGEAQFGHTSLAAARVLLASRGECTVCARRFDLTAEDTRNQVHIHTADSTDWPAALCNSCYTKMRSGGFMSFTDFMFSLNPPCPNCSAQRSSATVYGMLARRLSEPWLKEMGCVIEEVSPQWVCGQCGHQW